MSLVKSFRYALKGFMTAVIEQRNMKIHVVVATAVIVLGFYFGVTIGDWIILLILIGLVLSGELMNSALENLTDLVTKEQHPLAGKAKDMAASAVLILSITSAIVGTIVFLKYV